MPTPARVVSNGGQQDQAAEQAEKRIPVTMKMHIKPT
jgi:hypothetical protein